MADQESNQENGSNGSVEVIAENVSQEEANQAVAVDEEKTKDQTEQQEVCGTETQEVEAVEPDENVVEPMVEVASLLAQMRQDLSELGNDFRAKLKYDDHKQKIIDQLHKELQEYRNDLIRNLLRPVLMDVILLADDQRKLLANYNNKAPEALEPAKLLKLMNDIPDALDDLLYGQGVEIFSNDEPAFDPKCQKALQKVETHDPELNRTVARSIRPGYRWDGHLLRHEIVAVYVYHPPQEPTDEVQASQSEKEQHHE